jgi:hypothetical protein
MKIHVKLIAGIVLTGGGAIKTYKAISWYSTEWILE